MMVVTVTPIDEYQEYLIYLKTNVIYEVQKEVEKEHD